MDTGLLGRELWLVAQRNDAISDRFVPSVLNTGIQHPSVERGLERRLGELGRICAPCLIDKSYLSIAGYDANDRTLKSGAASMLCAMDAPQSGCLEHNCRILADPRFRAGFGYERRPLAGVMDVMG